jgi:thiol:disulfide interchange protein DsbC
MLRILAASALVICAAGPMAAWAAPDAARAAAIDPAHATAAADTAHATAADPAHGTAAADTAHGAPVDQSADPRLPLLKRLPAGSKLEDLQPSPIPGIYEFMQGADINYLTADGKYFLDGNVYDVDSRENLTEELRTRARVTMLSAVPESQMLIFGPKNPQYTITVFTDVDCGYCRKLHSDMAELNRMGVRVRYMFFPRTGPNTESWRKAEVVWCSPDRNDALTRAKAGVPLDMRTICEATPVARGYALGKSIGVRGTPAIVTENGDYISGYMPPSELVQQLKAFQLAKR